MAGGRYSKIHRRMWNDEKFRKLSKPQPCGQALWFRFLCGPELGPIPGLFSAREPGLADAMGWDLKPFRQSFGELSGLGLAEADWEAGLVWVSNAIKYNEPANPNVVKSWADAWAELPECSLKTKAFTAICDYLKERGESFLSEFRNHCPNHSANHCPNQEQDQEQEQEQEQEPETDTAAKAAVGSCSRKVCQMSEGFLKFWEAYPRKVAKGQAIKAWPGDHLLDRMLTALEWQAPSMRSQMAIDPSKVKHPATWLNALCWEDEKPDQAGLLFSRTPQRDVRHGMIRAEDCKHESTGEQKI
jgi:hypothetical protein